MQTSALRATFHALSAAVFAVQPTYDIKFGTIRSGFDNAALTARL